MGQPFFLSISIRANAALVLECCVNFRDFLQNMTKVKDRGMLRSYWLVSVGCFRGKVP